MAEREDPGFDGLPGERLTETRLRFWRAPARQSWHAGPEWISSAKASLWEMTALEESCCGSPDQALGSVSAAAQQENC